MKIITQKDLFSQSIDKFLKSFKNVISLNIEKGIVLDFKIETKSKRIKINPIIKLAKLEDVKHIIDICKDAYDGTYPFKEMEDEEAIYDMIESTDHHIFIFENDLGEIIGSFKCILYFEEKKAYMGGFMIKKKYQGKIDIVKAIIGSFMWMWSTYREKIYVWYCENRTAHATSQYITSVCGIKTIAFLPNKDVFFNKIESDVLGIIYQEKTLQKLRRKDFPKLIPEINNVFLYANKKYNLGPVEFQIPQLDLNTLNLTKYAEKLIGVIKKDRIGYETITLSMKGSNSYFKFRYTPWLQNFEKVEYNVTDVEELIVFMNEFKKLSEDHNIRYIEMLISAYNPLHQRILINLGLTPRGYIPCWKFNKQKNYFEDYIVFNHYRGELRDVILLPDGLELLESLNLEIT